MMDRAFNALLLALIANMVLPLEEADRLTAVALEMLEDEDGSAD